MNSQGKDIDRHLRDYLDSERNRCETLRGHAAVTQVIPRAQVLKASGSLPYIPIETNPHISVEFDLTNDERDFVDDCAQRWGISLERAYLRIMREALALYRANLATMESLNKGQP